MGFINQTQTREERQVKYKFLRIAGCNISQARRMRDWTISHIILYLWSKKNDANKS